MAHNARKVLAEAVARARRRAVPIDDILSVVATTQRRRAIDPPAHMMRARFVPQITARHGEVRP